MITTKPQFITFTGVDDNASFEELAQLQRDYPVEYAFLFSPGRQGKDKRYPNIDKTFYGFLRLVRFMDPLTHRMAIHLCGDYSPQLLIKGHTAIDHLVWFFDRVQINTSETNIDTGAIADWAQKLGVLPILQTRDVFPDDTNVQWLFDCSGGNGIVPLDWPQAPLLPVGDIGYAGGLNPDNVNSKLKVIASQAFNKPYWIDMESGVRDEDNNFDITRARAVCEAVYGKDYKPQHWRQPKLNPDLAESQVERFLRAGAKPSYNYFKG